MKKKKRITGSKYPKRSVITTQDRLVREAFYQATNEEAPLEPGQIATGTIQHPDTGLWQVWVSVNGLDFTQLAAFKQQAKANGAVEIINLEKQRGTLSNPAFVRGLFEFLEKESDSEVRPLPDELIRKLARDILHQTISQDEESQTIDAHTEE